MDITERQHKTMDGMSAPNSIILDVRYSCRCTSTQTLGSTEVPVPLRPTYSGCRVGLV